MTNEKEFEIMMDIYKNNPERWNKMEKIVDKIVGKSFDEMFPGLKGKIYEGDNIKVVVKDYDTPVESHGFANWICQGDIQKHCLDKQRVKELIQKIENKEKELNKEMYDTGYDEFLVYDVPQAIDDLKKGLGLE